MTHAPIVQLSVSVWASGGGVTGQEPVLETRWRVCVVEAGINDTHSLVSTDHWCSVLHRKPKQPKCQYNDSLTSEMITLLTNRWSNLINHQTTGQTSTRTGFVAMSYRWWRCIQDCWFVWNALVDSDNAMVLTRFRSHLFSTNDHKEKLTIR